MDPISLRFDPIPDPEIKCGDAVTVRFPDGTSRSLLVTDVATNEDDETSRQLTVLAWPE